MIYHIYNPMNIPMNNPMWPRGGLEVYNQHYCNYKHEWRSNDNDTEQFFDEEPCRPKYLGRKAVLYIPLNLFVARVLQTLMTQRHSRGLLTQNLIR